MPLRSLSLLSLLLLALAIPLQAEDRNLPAGALESGDSSEILLDAGPSPDPGIGDKVHTYLSENVEALSQNIDAFFGAERIYEESTDTYLQLSGSVIYNQENQVEFDGRVRIKLDLPRLEKRLKLVIESRGENDPLDEGLTSGAGTLRDTVEEKDLDASLQYLLRDRKNWDIRLQPGVRIKYPPEIFVRLRARWQKRLGEKWLTRATLRPEWSEPDGWDTRLRLDFDRRTGRSNLLRSASEIIWRPDEEEDFRFSQAFLFSHPLGERVRMAYETGVLGTIEPICQDTTYYANVRYRRDIYRGWMFLEGKPQVAFERENNFSDDWSFALTLEMLFGMEYLETARK